MELRSPLFLFLGLLKCLPREPVRRLPEVEVPMTQMKDTAKETSDAERCAAPE